MDVGGGFGDYVAGTAYMRDRHGLDIFFCRHDILKRNQYFSTTFDSGCRDMSASFWVNEDMSDMSRHVFRHLQLSKSAVGQLHRDRVDKEIVAKEIEESHRAQIKAMDDLHLGAINKLKKQNKDLASQMSEERHKSNVVCISFSLCCLLILILILNFVFLFLNHLTL